MVDGGTEAAVAKADVPASALFQNEWETYRKVVDHNYLFHREAYGRLREVLLREVNSRYRFLDIACGDASATVGALKGTPIDHYYGIDLSIPALTLAKESLKVLNCPVDLRHCDFVAAVHSWTESVDVVWIGQSLHHLQRAAKLSMMREIRRIVGGDGRFLIWEPTSPDGEDRQGWLRRYEDQMLTSWSALTEAEWTSMVTHTRSCDYPETVSGWESLGYEAGFARVRELFAAPTNINRMYCFD
jgi:SAM-dependent methyltransferase